MKFLKDLWHRIVSSNDEPYLQKIKELEEELKDANEEIVRIDSVIDGWIANYEEMKRQYESMQNTKNELLEELDSLKKKEVPYTIPTDIIDISKLPYLPYTLIYYYSTSKQGIETKQVQVTPSKYYRMWTDEMFVFFRNTVKNCKTFDEKVVKLRDVIKDKVKYEYDVTKIGKTGENWRFPIETFYGGIGDCEDTTALWVTACYICDLPADRIFNATGDYKQSNNLVGHSFGVAKFDNGKWYVIETTSKRKAIELIGSDYKIRGFLNGLSNWAISGEAKMEQF